MYIDIHINYKKFSGIIYVNYINIIRNYFMLVFQKLDEKKCELKVRMYLETIKKKLFYH